MSATAPCCLLAATPALRCCRALFWASAEDPDLAAARHDLTEPVIVIAVRVIGSIAADPDPQRLRATVRALVTMNVRSMLALPADATDADLDQLVDTRWRPSGNAPPSRPSPDGQPGLTRGPEESPQASPGRADQRRP